MIIVTTDSISNKSISAVYGLAAAAEGPSTDKTIEELYDIANNKLIQKAKSMGGNAVVGYRVEVSITQGQTEIISYGTVVLAEDEAL